MAGGKQSSRQKMINLMYLVFIAMMALNIDREVLRAFDNINTSLVDTNGRLSYNNEKFVEAIQTMSEKDPKYLDPLAKSKQIHEKTKPILAYIEKLKEELNGTEPKMDKDGNLDYKVLSNMENVTKMFFINDNNFTDKGKKLVSLINEFNTFLGTINKKGSTIKIDDQKKDGKMVPWLYNNFYGQPQVAATTTLTKIQTDVINSESEVIQSFLTSQVMENIKLNDVRGVISSPGFVAKGTQASTFAAIGAFDNRLKGSVNVNGRDYPLVNGQATIPLETGSAGVKRLAGTITYTDSEGRTIKKPLDPVAYEVVEAVQRTPGQAAATVTADNMNVLYVALENPITAAVVGVEPASLKISGAGVTYKGNGKGSVRPSSIGKIDITVSATGTDGRPFSKSFPFRVKSLPKPEGTVQGKTFLELPVASVKNQTVSARFVDFEWPLNIQVTGFKYKITGRGTQSVSGNSLSSISAKPGQVISIFDIKGTANGVPLKDATTVVIEVKN